MPDEKHIILTDPDCPRGTAYRLSAEYARRQPSLADRVPDEAVTVTIHHPSTNLRDMPVYDSSWA